METRTIMPLTAQALGRYIGKQVQIGENTNQRGKLIAVHYNFVTVSYNGRESQHYFRDVAIKPVLRRKDQITTKEYIRLFEILKGISYADWSSEPYNNQTAREYLTADEYLDGISCSELDRILFDIDCVDYLDSITIDIRGYLDNGLAVQ